jgi:DNA modification methylase
LLNEAKILFPEYSVGQGTRTDITSGRPTTGSKSRDLVASEIGISSSQLARLMFVEREDASLIDLIDKGIITTNFAYIQIQRLIKERKMKEQTPSKKVKSPNTDSFTFHQKSSSNMDEIEDGDVDLIYTSPPYWNKREYVNGGGLGNEKTPDEFIENLCIHLGDCYRVLNERGSMFVVIGDTFLKGNLLQVPSRVAMGLQDNGWILRNDIIWKKKNPYPSASKNNLTPSYEHIYHFVKSNDYKYEHTLGSQSPNNVARHQPYHRGMPDIGKQRSPYIPRDGKNIGDYWDIDVVTSAVARNRTSGDEIQHPAAYPEEIIILPLIQATEKGDLVLDPFHGSGTTGKVANQFGRRYIGYDIRSY